VHGGGSCIFLEGVVFLKQIKMTNGVVPNSLVGDEKRNVRRGEGLRRCIYTGGIVLEVKTNFFTG